MTQRLSDADLAGMLERAERNAPAIWVQACRELQECRALIREMLDHGLPFNRDRFRAMLPQDSAAEEPA